MQLTVEIEGEGPRGPLPGDGADLVALMSFAVVRGFGAEHPYMEIIDRLHLDYDMRLGPITTFYEGTVEDEEDAAKFELAWQDAGRLRESLEAMERGLSAGDTALDALIAEVRGEGLREQVAAVRAIAAEAEALGKKIRLSYVL
jgi:hypothetical protein